jgi:hypothetical protein
MELNEDLLPPSPPVDTGMGHVVDEELVTWALHNFVYKLVARLKKYTSHGIEVKDAPDTTGWDIRGYNNLDMGDGDAYPMTELFSIWDP